MTLKEQSEVSKQKCPKCGGFLYLDDENGPYCLLCGWYDLAKVRQQTVQDRINECKYEIELRKKEISRLKLELCGQGQGRKRRAAEQAYNKSLQKLRFSHA